MKQFLARLRARNSLLYYAGWLNVLGALVCMVLIFSTDTVVLGINAWIKPMKFFLSIAIFSWTMGWLLAYLRKQRAVKIYSMVIVMVLAFEMVIIIWQAANGRPSHFNITTPLYALLFSLMGIAITLLVVWTVYIAYLYFRQSEFEIPASYVWGIRLGLVMFIIFSFEGGVMASQLAHTVGAPDGGAGLPVVNWSTRYGDLRVAHFIGMHALQVLPLAGYYVFTRPVNIIVFSIIYFIATVALMVTALYGMPLLNY